MRADRMARMAVAAAVLALGAGRAEAGVTIAIQQADNDAPPKPMTMYLAGDRMRVSLDPLDIIFRGDLDRVWTLRTKAKSYIELTPESMAKASSAMNDALAKARESIANLPEAQRKQIEAMLASKGLPDKAPSPQAPAVTTYERAGADRSVGSWNCTPYKISVNGASTTEMCIARIADLGLTEDDIKPFADFGAFMSRMRSAMGGFRAPAMTMDYAGMTKAIGFAGFPVETRTNVVGGKHQFVSTVQSIRREDAPAGSFEIPDGYTKQDLAGMIGKAPGAAKP